VALEAGNQLSLDSQVFSGTKRPDTAPFSIDVLKCAVAFLVVVFPLPIVFIPIGKCVQATTVHLSVNPFALVNAAVGVEVSGMQRRDV